MFWLKEITTAHTETGAAGQSIAASSKAGSQHAVESTDVAADEAAQT